MVSWDEWYVRHITEEGGPAGWLHQCGTINRFAHSSGAYLAPGGVESCSGCRFEVEDPDAEVEGVLYWGELKPEARHAPRPDDIQIAWYINDLENALADARAAVLTQKELMEAVHPWAEELVIQGEGKR